MGIRRGNNPCWGWVDKTSAPLLKKAVGTLAGVCLSGDATTEHECGISGLRNSFGIDPDAIGIKKRQITQCPPLVYLEQDNITALLHFNRDWDRYTKGIDIKKMMEKNIYPFDFDALRPSTYGKPEPTLYGAWDEREFGILTTDEEGRKNLKEVKRHFEELDAAFWCVPGMFASSGLGISFPSCVTPSLIQEMEEEDLDKQKLKKAGLATGVIERVRKSNKRFFYLGAEHWTKDVAARNMPTYNTQYPVMFFLNPQEQHRYNSGLFTVEQLDAWINDKGIIIKPQQEAR